jgi:glycosyltransferase involved in cell wall biosynthesis
MQRILCGIDYKRKDQNGGGRSKRQRWQPMVIVFVVDNYLSQTDGTHVSARRFRDELTRMGHEVRVLSIGVEGPGMHSLRERYIPVVTPVARRSRLRFAQFDRETARKALAGADVMHAFFPWQLQQKTMFLAREMGVAVTSAFHCPPEHVSYNMGLKAFPPLVEFIFWHFKHIFFKHVEDIHCPSALTARDLEKHGYTARLHVISNGVSSEYKPVEKARGDDFIHVLCSGRLAPEKRQDLVIKAVNHSKHRNRIKLRITGQGVYEKRYRREAAPLPVPAEFGYLRREDLIRTMQENDIYVHASDVEAEGLACLEALSCGNVPIISSSPRSAASQFALDERSKFEKGNFLDLRDKLDYWIERPEERWVMRKKYAELGLNYTINKSAQNLLEMFAGAIERNKRHEKRQSMHDYRQETGKRI